MKASFVLLLIVAFTLVGCTAKEIVCEPPYLRHGAECCLDVNNNSVCDGDEPLIAAADSILVNGTVPSDNASNGAVVAPIEAALVRNDTANGSLQVNDSTSPNASDNLSFTEVCARDFLALNTTYFYYINKEGFGDIWVMRLPGKIKYTSPDYLFEVQNNTVVPSRFRIQKWDDLFILDIRERKLSVMDYIAFENGSYYGCYVEAGYYKRENCIKDNNSNSNAIIFENLNFERPDDPMDWLHKYDGQAPYLVHYNYTNKEDNLVRTVDEAFFNNSDGTTTKLIIQKHFRLPVEADIIGPDKVVKRRVIFKYLTTDIAYIKRWNPWFLES